MKKLFELMIAVLAWISPFHEVEPVNVIKLKNVQVETTAIQVTDSVQELDTAHLSDFLDAIGQRESSNNYKAVNSLGYLGRFQFGRRTLNKLGYEHVSNREFLSSPEVQEEAMIRLLEHNKYVLRRCQKYIGTTINGVEVTESGLLAGAHLAGPGNVRKWLRTNGRKDPADAYGTKLSHYVELFGGYDTRTIKSKR